MPYYERNLPHWQEPGAEYFVTFRLAGTLPKELILELQNQRKAISSKFGADRKIPRVTHRLEAVFFKKYEYLLDGSSYGPDWLKEEKVVSIVKEAIHYRDQKEYDLYAFCIMSNHVHMVFKDLASPKSSIVKDHFPVTEMLKNLKSYTGLQANRELGRKGSFWHEESYDHMIRNDESLERIISYTINNPVKVNLVKTWREWPHTYCKPEFAKGFDE